MSTFYLTIDECDLCHDIFPLRELHWTGTQFLCAKCRNERDDERKDGR